MLKILRPAFSAGLLGAFALAVAQKSPPHRHFRHRCLWSQTAGRPPAPTAERPPAVYAGAAALAVGSLGLATRLRRR